MLSWKVFVRNFYKRQETNNRIDPHLAWRHAQLAQASGVPNHIIRIDAFWGVRLVMDEACLDMDVESLIVRVVRVRCTYT